MVGGLRSSKFQVSSKLVNWFPRYGARNLLIPTDLAVGTAACIIAQAMIFGISKSSLMKIAIDVIRNYVAMLWLFANNK